MDSFSSRTLEAIIRHHRGNSIDDIAFRRIATGKFNTSYFVRAGNEQLVLRIAPPPDTIFVFYERNMMRQEPEIHQLILSETTVPIAQILTYDDSHDLIDRDYIIMERLPGLPLTEATGVSQDSVFEQVGMYLSQVHNLTAERYGYLGAHQPMEPQPNWVDAFEIMWNKMIIDIIKAGYYDKSEGKMMSRLLERYIAMFDHPVSASLLHMDIWHQNILVDRKGNVTGLVDWDRALWGDPEIEFAILDYCGVSKPSFWKGYGQERGISEPAHIRQIFYLLYELQKYIVIRHGRERDPIAAKNYKKQVSDIIRKYL